MKSLGRSRSVRGDSSPLSAESQAKQREPFCLGPFRQQKSFGPSTPSRSGRSRPNGENVPPDNSNHTAATVAYVKANTPTPDAMSPAQPKSSRKGRSSGVAPLPGSPALLPRPPSAKPSPTAGKPEQPVVQVQDNSGAPKRKLQWDGGAASAMETVPIAPTADTNGPDSGVKVIVRLRPLSSKEAQEEAKQIVQKISGDAVALGDQQFTYDAVASERASQREVFEMVGLPMVENCLAGFNSSIFAYGQTGSGKTHTMMGVAIDPDSSTPPSEERGLIPRVFERLFSRMQQEEKIHMDKELTYQCRCSFLEIYNEQITDLLEPSQKNLQIREDIKTGVYVDSLNEEFVSNVDDITRLLLKGLTNRRTGATNMNNESSRSHSVFTCVIESRFKNLAEGGNSVRSSRMNLVDLAGSERQKQTGSAGERLKEAGNINKSLSQLGNVINILAEVAQTGKLRHIPYRDSRLTFLLQESLGGNAKLAMICAVSPAVSCRSETLSTLRFAKRAKAIQNKAVVNEETSNDVGLLREQIRQLKDELMRMKSSSNQEAGTGGYSNGWNARRSYNLLRLSLSHPVTLSSPADTEDTDFEMEIEDGDREAEVEILPSENSGREVSKDAVVRLPAIDEKGGQEEDYCMEIDDSKTSDRIKDPSDSSAKVQASPAPPDLELPHITVRADSEVHSGLELLPDIDDDSVNVGCAITPPAEVPKTPEVSRIPELRIPSVSLHSPPLSISPRLRGNSRKGLSGSPLGPPLEIPAGDLPSANYACDEIYHSTQEKFCDGTSTSQSLQLQNGTLQQSNVRASTAARPTEKLAACLQRGLQILDNQQRTSLACVRRSTAAALRFSVQGNDIQIPKFVDRLEKGVQTSPIVLVTASTSPLAQTPNNFELLLSREASAGAVVEEPTDSLKCEDFQFRPFSRDALPDEDYHQQLPNVASAHVPPYDSTEDSGQFDLSPSPRLSESDCRSRADISQSAYHTPASITSKSSEISQWQMVSLDAPKCSVIPAGLNSSSKLQLAQAVEALLAGAIRREQSAEDAVNSQAAEIEQLNRLVRQYKHERECNSILHQTREDKIARLEALMDNTIPTDAYLNEEWSSLLLEHKLLQDKFDNHPEVTLSHVEQQRLRDELDQYRNFFDMGEREVLLEEVKHLRNQVVSLLEQSGNSSAKQRRLSVARMSLQTSKFAEAATECPSPSSLALLSAPSGVQKQQSELSMVVAGAACNISHSAEKERAEAGSRISVQEWEVEKREMEQDWEDRERDWMAVLEEVREEAESYKRQAEKRKQEVECEKRCSEEMQDALQMAMTGHARLLEQYAELQEKHISLLAKHRKIKEGTADVKKMAKKAGVTSAESRWLDAQAVQISALKVENEEEKQKSKEEIEGLQAQLRDTAEAVQAAGELLVRLKEAEESVTVAQDAVAMAEQDAGSLRRDMEKSRRRHATEVATLQQRLLESRLQKTAVCPMCVMAERVKFQFTEVDAETAQATLEAEARAMAIKEEQDWLALQRKKAAENPLTCPAQDMNETVWTGEPDEEVNGYDEYLSEEELHLDEFDDIDHLFTHT